jgi:hypothetical protein
MGSIERKARGFLYRPTGERIGRRQDRVTTAVKEIPTPAAVRAQEWRLKRERRLALIDLLKEESETGGSLPRLYAGLLLRVLLKFEAGRERERQKSAELKARVKQIKAKWKRQTVKEI